MKKAFLIAAASAVALAACAPMREEKSDYGRLAFVPTNPQVYVVQSPNPRCPRKRSIVVDQEPIYFFRDGKPATIVWQLQTDGFAFNKKAVISDPQPVAPGSPPGQIHSCQVNSDRIFTCINKKDATGTWKYTLDIVATDGCGNPPPLDPTIGND